MLAANRFDMLYRAQTAVCRKVYDAVPIAESWNAVQINAELARLGRNTSVNVTAGCLASLIDTGLVVEPSRGQFMRAPVRPAPPPTETKKEPSMSAPLTLAATNATPPADPLDRLGALALRLRQTGTLMTELAGVLEDVAVDVGARLEQNDLDLVKLKQLQALLKSLG